MVERKTYLSELEKWRDENVIKVITGLRRCGKSTLLSLFQKQLMSSGVTPEQIISINFEDLLYEDLRDYRALYQHITACLLPDRMNYIFLDEIQMVPEFQKAVDSLYIKDHVDLYLTGSNAYLLSGGEKDRLFSDYLRYGALPYLTAMTDPEEKADTYLEGIYNTIIVKDIELRQQRRENDPNKRRISDISLLRSIARFLANSIGSPVSVKSIADYITSSGRKVSPNTISDYVDALIEPYIFYPAERFDVIGKELLKQNRKLYIVDLGLRRHLVPRQNYDLGFSIENVVYLELLRRGYTVNIGKINSAEVDFVARKGELLHYYQVTASLTEKETFDREFSPLRAIADNYPKTVLTLDRFTPGNYNGIEAVNIIDWLLA